MYFLDPIPPFKQFHHLILDVDGTIVEGPKLFYSFCKYVFEKEFQTSFRYRSAADFNRTLPRSVKELLIEHGHDEAKRDEFLRHFSSHYRRHARLLPWVHRFLNDAKEQYQLSVCSNNDEELVRGVMGDHETLIIRFHCRSGSQYRKPEIAFYRELFERFGIDLWDSIYVTDEFLDAFRARLAGISEVALVTWGHAKKEDIDTAKKLGIPVISSVEELYQFLGLKS